MMKFLVQQQPAFVYTGGKEFDAAKPSIIFIHGAANDHSVWTLQARYFAHHGFNVLAVDLPGHGKSFGVAKTTVYQAQHTGNQQHNTQELCGTHDQILY